MDFEALIEARDKIIAHDDGCEMEEELCKEAYDKAVAAHAASSQDRELAHKAIADLLKEKGEHYLQLADGTLNVYKPWDESPLGYLVVQPIPGAKPKAGAK
jgi:hypothetical protein